MEDVRIFEVQECREEYLVAVNRLLEQLSEEKHELSREDFEEMLGSGANKLFLLSCGSIIAGMLCVCVYSSPIGRKAWIEDVVVDSRFRGRAFGKLLVKHALEYARTLGNVSVMLTSRPSRVAANALYRSMGFELKKTNVYRKKF